MLPVVKIAKAILKKLFVSGPWVGKIFLTQAAESVFFFLFGEIRVIWVFLSIPILNDVEAAMFLLLF